MIPAININTPYKTYYRPNFKGYNSETQDVISKNKQNWCLHQTAFFRDIDTMDFTKKYIIQNFPAGTHIADFGCSNGEEAYTLMMLLKANNTDKRYKVTGYDISQKVLDLAQSGPFKINYRFTEGFVTSDIEYQDYDRKYLRPLFFDSFKSVSKRFLEYNPHYGDVEYLTERINQEKNLKKCLELKCFREIVRNPDAYRPNNAYTPKTNFVKGIFDTKLGDISDIAQILKPDGKTGVIIFKNAWYHVTGSRYAYKPDLLNLAGADKIMHDANIILPKGGIFVVGTLEKDHLYSEKDNPIIKTIRFNNNDIKVCEDTPFHALLRKNGFVPVFYEIIRDVLGDFCKNKIHLPSVWKKI